MEILLEQLRESFADYTTRDFLISFVDIVLVYYVIYRILLLIRGTKAVQVLVGLLAVVVLYFASEQEYLGLGTLNWLLDKFIASFIVILVIIFRDEIRRGLSHVGRSSRFTGLSKLEQAHFLEEVVKAAGTLSEKKIGALIVIEREAILDEYTIDGIPIDAMLTKELLISLFIPLRANPTHDGAVIVQKGRVAASGCFLPLTTDPRIDKELGTRHRAALGLSEATDAVTVIVSEETGIVSVAFKDELTRRLSNDELRDLLQHLFSENEPSDDTDPKSGFMARLRNRRGKTKDETATAKGGG